MPKLRTHAARAILVAFAASFAFPSLGVAQERGERREGRGGPGRRFGSGRTSEKLLAPEDLEFIDGVASVADRATFKKLSYQGPEVLIDTHLDGLQFVKFQIEKLSARENGGDVKPQLYFINTKTHRGHPMFMRAIGIGSGFGRGRGRGGPGRGREERDPNATPERMRGVLVYRPLLVAPNGTPGVYTFEYEPNDNYGFKWIKFSHDLLVEKMPILKGKIGYYPMYAARPVYKEEKSLYDKAEFPVYLDKDLFSDIGYLPLNLAESFGRLRLMKNGERPSSRDVVLYKTLPNEMPRVAGIITGERQTPLSHVNLRAIQDDVPNAFVTKAWENEQIAPLIGKYVHYKVAKDGFEIREAKPEEVDEHFAAIRPAKTQKPKRDLRPRSFRPLAKIEFGHRRELRREGGKPRGATLIQTSG